MDEPEVAGPVSPTAGFASALERALRRDRALVALGIVAMTLLSWAYVVRMAGSMSASAADDAMHAAVGVTVAATWGGVEFTMLFLMWAAMMAAMMLPSAAPTMLLVVGTYRRRRDHPHLLTAVFASGYLVAWTIFSAAAALTQLMLHWTAMLSPAMVSTSTVLGGGILLLAGIYQWLPLKAACLTHCRSPLAFLTDHWREGTAGAFAMGLRHGWYCVGCCWGLMLLLFVAGVMNLLWVGVLAAFVLVEKLAPHGARLGKIAGILFVIWGGWVLASGF